MDWPSVNWDDTLAELRGLLDGETDPVANAANTAALLWARLPDVNWAGFYFLRGDVLVLGPFQGKPACVRIPLGQGVCGTAAARRETIVVPDVHAFPGHIACDAASAAEIVVPLVRRGPGDGPGGGLGSDGAVVGVLDIDSPRRDRFTPEDQAGCEAVAAAYLASCAGG